MFSVYYLFMEELDISIWGADKLDRPSGFTTWNFAKKQLILFNLKALIG